MADLPGRHLIVTGGTGYIGQRVVELALRQGRQVTLLGRNAGPIGTRHVPWTLGEPFPVAAQASDIAPHDQALVHLAHDWQGPTEGNIEGTADLFAGARAAGLGARVFVSSQSAREGALNRYGRIKWAIEQRLPQDVSLRVGLVYGGPLTAMYGLLCRITRLPILPMIDPHRCVQPIHRDEVADGIFAAIDKRLIGVFALAGPEPMPFGEVLRSLACGYGGRRLPVLPVPLRLALLGCDVTAKLPLFPTVDRERVLGLAGTEPIDAAEDLATLGIVVRPLAQGLAREPLGRRALIAEAKAFLRHAVPVAPEAALIKRYVRAFPDGAISRPRLLLGWREPVRGALAARLRVAARIAEAGAAANATLSGGSRFGRLAVLGVTILLEALKLPSRSLAGLRKA